MSLPEVQDTGNLMDEFQGYDQSHEDFMSTCVRCRKTTDAATPRDTKKKERLGHLPRRGSCYSTDVQFVYDHDYRRLATGVLVPHGVYDYHDNVGFITLGTFCWLSF